MPRGLKFYFLIAWLLITPLTISAGLFGYFSLSRPHFGSVLAATDGPYSLFTAQPPVLGNIAQEFFTGDARPLLVEKFLRKYNSPMQGNGELIVELADRYGIDWKLVPAIAFQESSLGKVMPKGSFNAWGWAIYTGKNSGAAFDSWAHAIETVTRGLANDYYKRELKTPLQIQSRYTPQSNGSWAEAVQFAMDDLED